MKTIKLLFTLLLFSNTISLACDATRSTVTGVIDNGDGTYTVTINACMEPDDGGGSVSLFKAAFTGANVVSASPSTITYSDGTVHTLGAIAGNNGNAQWSGSTVSTLISQECFTFTVVLNGQPTGLTTDNGRSGCFHNATFPTITNLTCNTSGGSFTDSGGATGNYSSNENTITTICPDSPGGIVTVSFSGIVNTDAVFSSCKDILSIYQGNSTSGSVVGLYCENDPTPGTIVSTDPSGCLTFQFVSDGSTNRAGWNATVSCDYPCAASGTLSGSASICQGEATNLSIALTGSSPWSITYTDGTTPVTVNGITSSPHVISVSPTTNTNYSLSAVSDANCSGAANGTASLTVGTAVNPTYTTSKTDVTCVGPNTGTITITPTSPNTTFDWVSGPITSVIPGANLPGGAIDEREIINLPTGDYCVDIIRTSPNTSNITLFTETFESGSSNWTIDNATGPNIFVVNNNYPGGSCVTGLGTFTVPVVPNQPPAVTAGPTSNYLHIMATTTTGVTCGGGSSNPFPPLNANFDGQISDQKATMNTPLNTTGMSNVVISYYWLAQGETSGQDDFGAIEYSLDGGTNWTQIGGKLRDQTTWLNSTNTDPSWDNQASLLFRIRWQNDASSSIDPPLSIDQIVVTADVTSTCPATIQECFTIAAPANITPTFTALTPVCQNAAGPVLPMTSNNGITGSWSPAMNTATSGNKTFTFTPDAGQCAETTTLSLTVNPILTPAVTCGTLTTTSVQFNWTTLAGVTNYAISYTVNGGAPISGSTVVATSFTANGLTPGDVVAITVTPSGTGCYTAGTGSCTANPCTPPVIDVQPPADQTVCEGLPVTFSVQATGGTTFQWEFSTDNGSTYTDLADGGIYSGVTTLDLSISDVTGLDGNIFQLVINGPDPSCPALSNPATTLTVTPKVTPTFSAIADFCENTASPSLQGTSINAISGTWNPAAVLNTPTGSTTYTFTPNAGECANSTTLDVIVDPNFTPVIICGVSTTSSVAFDWQDVTGATSYNISYSINGGAAIASTANVSNINITSGITIDDVVDITVTPVGTACYLAGTGQCTASSCTPPVINSQPVDDTNCEGTSINISVSETGGNSYQWQISTDGGTTFSNLSDNAVYQGTGSTTLIINDNTGLNNNQYQVIISEINNACPTTSNAATLTVNPTQQPVITCGTLSTTDVNFNWNAIAGATDYTISYLINGGPVQSGGTVVATTFNVSGLNVNDQVDISVTPNGVGCFTDGSGSCIAILCNNPIITTQPISDNNCEGNSLAFSAVENGGNAYQWQESTDGGLNYTDIVDGGIYSGATTVDLAISDNTGLDGNMYQLVISEVNNSCPTTSDAVSITATAFESPTVSCNGTTVNSVTFEWTSPSNAVDYDLSYTINGGTATTAANQSSPFTVTGLSPNDVVDITVTTNGTGCYTDGTGSCTAVACNAPVISTQPTDNTSCEGTAVTFSVVENGGTSYQWQVSNDGGTTFIDVIDVSGIVSGATTTDLSITDNTGLDGTIYQLVINEINNTCPTTSNQATLNVNSYPVITIQPANSTSCEGNAVTFSATETGGNSYQWQVSNDGGTTFTSVIDVPGFVSGATSSTLTINDNSGLDGTIYQLIINDVNNACPITSDIANLTVNPYPVINATNNGPLCDGDVLNLSVEAIAGATYDWNATSFSSSEQNPSILVVNSTMSDDYTVSVDLAGCISTSTTTVVVNSPGSPIINAVGPFCANDPILNLTSNLAGGTWSGSGIIDPVVGTFNPASATSGQNTITYTLNSTCGGSTTANIAVNPNPIADFITDTYELDPTNPVLITGNYSQNATTFEWNFGDLSTSTLFEPSHLYDLEASAYTVQLIAISDLGCRDTTSVTITIPETLIYYIPNAFTPNGDEHNNTFKPVFYSGYDPLDYSLTIYNRWGERIFESRDPEIGWDGTYADLGIEKTDVYVWKVTFGLSFNAEKVSDVGSVTLLR